MALEVELVFERIGKAQDAAAASCSNVPWYSPSWKPTVSAQRSKDGNKTRLPTSSSSWAPPLPAVTFAESGQFVPPFEATSGRQRGELGESKSY